MGRRTGILIIGAPLSVIAGIVLAFLVYGAFYAFGTLNLDGGFCSRTGIGEPQGRNYEGMVALYIDDWSGFPPRQRCRVYLVDDRFANRPGNSAQILSRTPNADMVAEEEHPTSGQTDWVLFAFIAPAAAWFLLLGWLLATGRRTRDR